MEMKKLPKCRICLVENVRMVVFAYTNLQEIYEKLTDIPLVTEDSRPMHACFICHDKLKQCYQLQRQCLEAEERFAQMFNEDCETKPQINRGQLEFSEYAVTPMQHISVLDDCHTKSAVIKEESPTDDERQEGKQHTDSEHECKDIAFEYISPHRSASGDTPPRPFESRDEGDSEDDLPLMEFKIEIEEESAEEPEEMKRDPGVKKSKQDAWNTKIEDTITTQQKNTEQPDSEIMWNTRHRTSKPATVFKEPFTRTTPIVSNSINVTSKYNSLKKRYNYCVKCKLSFNSSFDLIQHIRTHATDKPHKCKLCQRSFSDESNLKTHLQSHTTRISNICQRDFSDTINLFKPYDCDICQHSFGGKNDLIRHIRVHTGEKPYKCETCQRSFSERGSLKRHIRSHTGEKPFKCEVCQRSLSSSHALKIHRRQHIPVKLYKCELCQLSFEKEELSKHSLIHTNPYKCEICQCNFSNKDDLSKHVRVHTYTAEKPFNCDICQRSFDQKDHLQKHLCSPTDKKPFQCDVCGRFYSDKSTLEGHIETHTGVKSFKCDVCQRNFVSKSNLNQHTRTHSDEKPFKCETCQRSFGYAHHLKEHMLIHTGEKPFVCKICPRGFVKANHLKLHMRTHTGEKPYKCEICQRSFNRADNMKIHIRTHTGESVRRVRVRVKKA